MTTKRIILAGTGHRPAGLWPDAKDPYAIDLLKKLVDDLIPILKAIQPTGIITGMALGFDTALALAAIKAGIPFVAAIPFQGQEAQWPQASQDTYHAILKRAANIFAISTPGYAAFKMHLRNEWMVDHSTHIITCYNGDQKGGTASCLRYAEKQNRPIIHLPFPPTS